MKDPVSIRTKSKFLGWILSATFAFSAFNASSASAEGTIVFRGLTSGIESSWWNNTSGNSYTAWAKDSETGFARISYNTSHDYGLNYTLPDRTRRAIYVKMWIRQNGGTAAGPKNFKIFGQGYPTKFSNTTIGLAGYGNEYDIYYGDSATSSNDAAVEWRFTGITWGGTVLTRAAPTVVTKTINPPKIDNSWHEWGYYVKFNDDNVQNGEIIVLYDGKEIFHLKNVYNHANGQGPIDNFGIGQFFQPSGGSYSMSRDYRDVRLAYDDWPASTDIYGNFTGATVSPPAAPVLTTVTPIN
jgi:hypothetical protein